MKLLIVRSRRKTSAGGARDPYTQEFGSAYAERVIGNLLNAGSFCSACGPECTACRQRYGRNLAEDLAGVIELPPVLPYLLERPGDFVPADLPPHDILLAINVHEQILVELAKELSRRGAQGIVAPIESRDWISGSAQAQMLAVCKDKGMEVSFPKPFCAFDPPAGSVLAAFREQFHIGRPRVELTVRHGRIERAYVGVSAACGATYYVARHLEGRRVDDDLKYEVVAKKMHSYPCTASMKWDDELGDTIMHVASQAHYGILAPLMGEGRKAGPGLVMSPVGRMVQKPVPARENTRHIERAKEAILEALAHGDSISLASLRKGRALRPAALSSAVLLLKQEGRIRTEGRRIVRA
jgi:hypothetical protein